MSNKKNCIIPVYNRKCLLKNDKDLRVFFDWFFCLLFKNGFSAYSANYNYWIMVYIGPELLVNIKKNMVT